MKHIKYTLVILAAISLLSDCITPYDLKVGGFEDLLVVEGVIVDGETTIRLSRSMPLNPDEEEWAGARPVSGARVWIEGENGDRFDAIEQSSSGWGPVSPTRDYIGEAAKRATRVFLFAIGAIL